jgi:hypothetical protein
LRSGYQRFVLGANHGHVKDLPYLQWLLAADKRPAKTDIFYFRCYGSIGGLYRDRPIDINSRVLAFFLPSVLTQLCGCKGINVRTTTHFPKVVDYPDN